MTILNICGFESGSTLEIYSGEGTYSIQSTIKHSGTYALKVNPTTTANGFARIGKHTDGFHTSLNAATACYSFFGYIATLPTSGSEEFAVLVGGAGHNKLWVRLTSAGNIQAYDTTGTTQLGSDGTTTLSLNLWYFFEIKCGTGNPASYEIKIDGIVELSGTGNLWTSNNTDIALGKVVNRNNQSVVYYYDDLAIDDNNYPGTGSVAILKTNAGGTYDTWTILNGTGNKWEQIDEIPHDSDTTRLQSTLGIGDAYTAGFENAATGNISGTIYAIKECFIGLRFSSGAECKMRIYSGGVNSDSSAIGFSFVYAMGGYLLTTDPSTGLAWTTTGIDAIEVGGVENNASVKTAVTAIYLMVYYNPNTDFPIATTESITITDIPIIDLLSFVNKSESVTVADTPTVQMSDLTVAVAETIAVTDTPTAEGPVVDRDIAITEPITVTDTPTVQVAALNINVSEAITVTTTASAGVGYSWFLPTTLTITKGAILSGALTDTYSDNSVELVLSEKSGGAPGFAYDFTFGDFEAVPTSHLDMYMKGYYIGNPTHIVKLQQYNYTTASWTNVTSDTRDFPSATSEQSYHFLLIDNANYISGGKIQLRITHTSPGSNKHEFHIDYFYLDYAEKDISKSESISVTDTPTVAMAALAVNVNETVAVADTPAVTVVGLPTPSPNVSESITVTESVTAAMTALEIAVSETITVDDVPALSDPGYAVEVNEAISVTDTPALEMDALAINVSEAISVTDTSAVAPTWLISVSESITVTDTPALDYSLFIDVSESITVTDTPGLATDALVMQLFENVTVGDSPVGYILIEASASDAISLGEAIGMFAPEPPLSGLANAMDARNRGIALTAEKRLADLDARGRSIAETAKKR